MTISNSGSMIEQLTIVNFHGAGIRLTAAATNAKVFGTIIAYNGFGSVGSNPIDGISIEAGATGNVIVQPGTFPGFTRLGPRIKQALGVAVSEVRA